MEAKVTLPAWYWFPVTGPDYAGADYFVIVERDGATVCNPSPMGQDAARLIAAAPELLATLQRLLAAEARMGGNNPLAGLCDEARELIARATGAP